MTTWNDDSGLMRLNRAPVGETVEVPAHLARVLALGLAIGRASGGAGDIGMGDAVRPCCRRPRRSPSWPAPDRRPTRGRPR